MNSLNKLVTNARKKSGLSQSNIARAFGFRTPQFVSNWERNLVCVPPERFKKLAKLLKLDPEDMIAAAVEDYERELRAKARVT